MAYAGGKGRCFQRIINLMPPHRVYIELFLGSGAVLRHKKPAEVSIGIDLDERVIAAWSHEISAPIRTEHGDAFAFLREHEFGADQLVYADPPYLPSARRQSKIYRHDLEEVDHVRLLDLLASLPSHVMISGYPSELYDRMLVGWRRTEFAVGSQAGLRDEVVWHNFDPPTVLHDYGHLGNDYRERQRLKRKANRWRRRLEAMPEGERHALLSALGDLAPPPPAPSSAFAS